MYPTPQSTPPVVATHKEDQSIGELLSTLTQDLLTLVRQEMMLAKTEMSQKLAHVTKNLGLLVAGGAVAYAGLILLLMAVAMLLTEVVHLPGWLSYFLVGAVAAGGGGFLVMNGIKAIRKEDLTPHQTLESLKELKNG